MAVLLDSQTAQQGGGIALGVPSLQFGEFLLQLGGLDSVLVGEVRLGVDGVFLAHYVPQHRMAAEHGLEHCAVVKLEMVLAQYRQTLSRSECHRSLGGL